MLPKKPINVSCAQAPEPDASVPEPSSKVFNDCDTVTNPSGRVPAPEQMPDEQEENYAKVVGHDALPSLSALENLFEDGETRNMVFFQGSAMFPPSPIASQVQLQLQLQLGGGTK